MSPALNRLGEGCGFCRSILLGQCKFSEVYARLIELDSFLGPAPCIALFWVLGCKGEEV